MNAVVAVCEAPPGLVTSAVVISVPDTREGNSDVDEDTLAEVQKWWKQNMAAHGADPENYEKQIINDFGTDGAPDLLIVVDKLLTGFDAPPCTYLYIDKSMQDHGLFQAICRTNRLDGDDKDYGHIVDFKELFGEVQEAIAVYSSDELDTDPGDGGDNNVHLKDWLAEGKRKLDEAREALRYLCATCQCDPVVLWSSGSEGLVTLVLWRCPWCLILSKCTITTNASCLRRWCAMRRPRVLASYWRPSMGS